VRILYPAAHALPVLPRAACQLRCHRAQARGRWQVPTRSSQPIICMTWRMVRNG
jgi:hypothetical protein